MIEQKSINVLTPFEANREKMKDFTVDQKIEYNLSHFFSTRYLIKNGYDILNLTIEQDTGHQDWRQMSSQELGEYFIFWFKREYPSQMLSLYKEMKKWFEANPSEIYCNSKIYLKFI